MTGSRSEARRVVFLDGFAGRGRYDDGSPASPERILRIAQNQGTKGTVAWTCFFVEAEEDSAAELVQVVDEYVNKAARGLLRLGARVSQHRSEGSGIALDKILRQVGPLGPKVGKRAAGSWVVQIARHEMGVQVGEGVAQHLIIHLQRVVVPLKGLGDTENLQPVPRRLGGLKLGWLRHVPSSPDHEGVPPLHIGLLEVGVAVLGRLDTDAKPVVIGPALRAHRAASARHHRGPVCWPCRSHARSPLAGRSARLGRRPGPMRSRT
jgi:hypothetical protein